MKKKIIVTGATGYIGRAVLNSIVELEESYDIICLSRRTPVNLTGNSSIAFEQVDISNIDDVSSLLKKHKPDVLIHLAWQVVPKVFWTAIENVDWVLTSVKLFESFAKNGGTHFVSAGSIAEYDLSMPVLNASTKPNTLYGECKASTRRLIYSLRDTYYNGVRLAFPQIGWFFGETESKEKLFSKIVYCLKNNEPIVLNCENIQRPYAHVKYAGDAISKCLLLNNDSVFPLTSKYDIRLEDIVMKIAEILGVNYNIIYKNITEPTRYEIDYSSTPELIKNCIIDTLENDIRGFVETFDIN